jgi:magnesium chelatase family protein
MAGSPGSGKSMLAARLPSILPPLSPAELLEVSMIASVAGRLRPGQALVSARPFRAPHHSISDAGLIGGGAVPRPGEVSLAHHGVLFLDEIPELRRSVLETLRQPLEDGIVHIGRARVALAYPARFMLVAAMNPCPCGYHGTGQARCTCLPGQIERYRARISGPLLDRIDLQVEVPALRPDELAERRPGETSALIRERVALARERQSRRFRGRPGLHANAHMGVREVDEFCRVGKAAEALLRKAVQRLGLSARAYHRILKLARTIADLAGTDSIEVAHVAEAIQYRSFDRVYRPEPPR